MRFFKKIGLVSRTTKELFSFLWENKLWWMVPIVSVFLLLGLLIWLAQSSVAVPFIYALF